MPAPPAVADYNDDGYLDVVYIGDVTRQHVADRPDSRTWRPCRRASSGDGQVHGYVPFQLFDACKDVTRCSRRPGAARTASSRSSMSPASCTSAARPLRRRSASRSAPETAPSLTRSNPTGHRTGLVLENNSFILRHRRRRDTTLSRNDLIDLTDPPINTARRPTTRWSAERPASCWTTNGQREDDVDGVLDPGRALDRDVHSRLGQPLRHQRKLVPLSLLLPDGRAGYTTPATMRMATSRIWDRASRRRGSPSRPTAI